MGGLGEDVSSQIKLVEDSLADADKFFKTLQALDYDEVTSKLTPIDRARYDLTVIYAINSLFWMLKRSYGGDPQTEGIKDEMERIKGQMVRLKEVTEAEKRPKVDRAAAERVIRHELNIRKRKRKTVQEENWENEQKDQ